jgi:hypothetical protein
MHVRDRHQDAHEQCADTGPPSATTRAPHGAGGAQAPQVRHAKVGVENRFLRRRATGGRFMTGILRQVDE